MSALIENVAVQNPEAVHDAGRSADGGRSADSGRSAESGRNAESGRIGMPRAEGTLHQLVRPEPDSSHGSQAGGAQAAGGRRRLLVAGGVLLVIVAIVAFFLLRGHGAAPPKVVVPLAPAATDRAALTVELATPKIAAWARTFKATGSISAWQDALVGAEVSGLRISQVLVDVGDQVRRGQLLARFDDSTMQAAVAQQRAAVAEAQANAAEADANAQRAAFLRKSGALSEQNIIQYETRARAVRAQVESAQARLRSAELALQYTRVTAPDDGVISSRNAMLGAVASPGAELFRLVRQNRIEWRAEVPASQLALISAGQAAQIQLQDGSSVQGVVRQVAPVLNETSRVGIAYVELDRARLGHARPGMYASGVITLGEQPALTVPSSAIVQRDGHEYVFTVGPDARVLQNKVVVGRRIGADVEVQSGMSAGMQVVKSGAPFLNEGDVVRIVGARAQ